MCIRSCQGILKCLLYFFSYIYIIYLSIINNFKNFIQFFSFLFFTLSKHKSNTTELHLKVRPTCLSTRINIKKTRTSNPFTPRHTSRKLANSNWIFSDLLTFYLTMTTSDTHYIPRYKCFQMVVAWKCLKIVAWLQWPGSIPYWRHNVHSRSSASHLSWVSWQSGGSGCKDQTLNPPLQLTNTLHFCTLNWVSNSHWVKMPNHGKSYRECSSCQHWTRE